MIRPFLETGMEHVGSSCTQMPHEGTKGSVATPSRLIILKAHFSDGNLPDSFPSGTGFGARLD